jgi:RNA polymerase sigma-70 factor (ECF subfamily)
MQHRDEVLVLRSTNDDHALIMALRNGESTALSSLISRYGGYVQAVVRRTAGSFAAQEDIEEMTSDVFVQLWRNAGRLNDDSNLKAWLAVVARNRALRWLRGFHSTEAIDDETTVAIAPSSELDPEMKAVLDAMVSEAFSVLAPRERDLVERYYLEDSSIAQIAEETGLTPSAVKSRLHRARKQMKDALEGNRAVSIKERS